VGIEASAPGADLKGGSNCMINRTQRKRKPEPPNRIAIVIAAIAVVLLILLLRLLLFSHGQPQRLP